MGNYRLVNLTSVPGKVVENILLGTIPRHMKNKVIWDSQHGFRKGMSCLINLIAFYNEVTGWWSIDKWGAVHIVYLVFSKAFDTCSQNILVEKLKK